VHAERCGRLARGHRWGPALATVAALWEDWQARRVVRQAPARTWQFAGPDAARLGRVNDLLNARLARLLDTDEPGPLEAARELLATAALEGRRFTAPALQ
jgi:hypothetical protein